MLMWKSTTSTKYYVVSRGLLPGIYKNPAMVLKNISNIPNTQVLRFTDPNAAAMAWRRELKANLVTPLGAFYQPPPSANIVQNQLPINIDYPDYPNYGYSDMEDDNDDDSLSFTLTEVSDIESAWGTPADVDNEACKWVVYKGRLPGIFDTW